MGSVTLDESKLVMLRMFSDAERSEIVGGMLKATEQLLSGIPALLDQPDLTRAAEEAHRGRNEALVVGATELGEAFAALEDAGRRMQLVRAHAALGRLQALWPPTRSAVKRLLAETQANL